MITRCLLVRSSSSDHGCCRFNFTKSMTEPDEVRSECYRKAMMTLSAITALTETWAAVYSHPRYTVLGGRNTPRVVENFSGGSSSLRLDLQPCGSVRKIAQNCPKAFRQRSISLALATFIQRYPASFPSPMAGALGLEGGVYADIVRLVTV